MPSVPCRPLGLTPEEVARSRQQHGANRLTPPAKESLWRAFFDKFRDPLIIVLLVVLVVSTLVATVEYCTIASVHAEVFLEPLGVLVALLLATGVGFVFEVRAARAFDVLNQVNEETPVKVLRCLHGRSQIMQIPQSEVVVGDVLFVETGDEIPADGRLFEAVSLSVNESTLTGEPSTHKYVPEAGQPPVSSTQTYEPDQLMKGTTVIEGHGIMEVTAVGDASEYGHVCHATQISAGVMTPLNRQLEDLGSLLSRLSFWVAGAIVVGRFVYFFFFDGDPDNSDTLIESLRYFLNSVMIAVTLIVVSVPEGLPLSITLSLALSMKKMLRQNNLVRKLHACETMGAATVICTDKTGTLTQNRMSVSELLNFTGDSALLAEAIAVNSTAWLEDGEGGKSRVLGNPTEGALLFWLRGEGIDYVELRRQIAVVKQVPFTTESKRMSTTVDSPHLGKRVVFIKGAPEMLLNESTEIAGGVTRAEVLACLQKYQQQAMRTLGFVYYTLDAPERRVFMGITSIADPVRPEVPEAIRTCRKAGIRVIIVTGDTIGTACEIARQVGVMEALSTSRSEVLTGPEFSALSDEELIGDILPTLKVLARARPLDKQRLVQLLQQMDHVVAVTGDGTNDAPALNAAQVGLSMGDGTAVAKEASDITIIDNSFSSITQAVLWGRSLYHNIGRFILFQMTVNVAACFIVLIGAFIGRESPLSVTQMLWVNLIMDTFAAMALSALPPEPSVMNDPPRSPQAHIINRRMLAGIFGWGVPLSLILLFCWLEPMYFDIPSVHVPHSWFFTIFVMLQFWNLFNARYYRTGRSWIGDVIGCVRHGSAALRATWSWGFMGIAVLILVGQILIVTFGGEMFHIPARLTLREWLYILLGTSPVFLLGDLIRWIRSRH